MKIGLWTVIGLPPAIFEPLRKITPEAPSLSSLSRDSNVDLRRRHRSYVFYGLTPTLRATLRAKVVASTEQPLTHLFLLSDRNAQSSSPAIHGEHTASFSAAGNLALGLIDQRVLKQRWGCQLLNILKPNDNIHLSFLWDYMSLNAFLSGNFLLSGRDFFYFFFNQV